jgi:ribonuclease-3
VFAVEARLENEAGERVLAAAEGSSKKEAQQRAAELALMSWSEVSQSKTRGER